MNQIINTFLLAGDKFMPEVHLRQPGFTYSASSPFTNHKQRIQTTSTGINWTKIILLMMHHILIVRI